MNINLDDNKKMKEAYELVCNTDENVFITGKAGTGKTTLLHYIEENCHKSIAIVAPTGIAAINAGGNTIHSLLGIPFGPFRPNIIGKTTSPGLSSYVLNHEKVEVLRHIDTLIIDEVSMVRADLMDAINDSLCVHRNRCGQLFGGVQIVMFGDLYQLSPIVKPDEEEFLGDIYKSHYFFDSWALNLSGFKMVELNKVYRQKEPGFIKILNEVRGGSISKDNYDKLKERFNARFKPKEPMITICSHNAKADKINSKELGNLQGKEYVFNSSITGEFNDKAAPCDMILRLKKGAQVMLISNHPDGMYCNGSIGTIEDIKPNEKRTCGYDISVKLDSNGMVINVDTHEWDNFKLIHDLENGKIKRESIGKCSQLPLKLAWAITIHKSQGLTFDKAIIDAGRSFAEGQIYVALSRCRSLENMHLISMFTPAQIKSNKTVLKFMRNKRSELAQDVENLETQESDEK